MEYKLKIFNIFLLFFFISVLIIKITGDFLYPKLCINKYLIYFITTIIILFLFYYLDIYYWCERSYDRTNYYELAKNRSIEINKPLIVIGNPDSGPTNKIIGRLYDCGDYTIDINGSPNCPINIKEDIVTALKKIKDNSSVIYISYVLEYIDNIDEAIKEINRVAGNYQNIFIIHAQNNSNISKIKYSSGKDDPSSKNIIDEAPPKYKEIKYHKIKEYMRNNII